MMATRYRNPRAMGNVQDVLHPLCRQTVSDGLNVPFHGRDMVILWGKR